MMGQSRSLPPHGCRQLQSQWQRGRREILQAGVLSLAGLGLPQLLSAVQGANQGSRHSSFGQAKRCIFLFMWGGPSQLDTFDLKPLAPPEVRGLG